MTFLKLFIAFFISRFIYDLILHYLKLLYQKSKENKIKNKLKKYINKIKNKNLCNSCIYYSFQQNKCLFTGVYLTKKMKKCSAYKKDCGWSNEKN